MTQHYEILLKGHLDRSWSEWLGGLAISHQDNGETLLTVQVVDQAALFSLISRLRDGGITLVSINPMGQTSASSRDDDDETTT